jgi:NADPH2:quinone reductase
LPERVSFSQGAALGIPYTTAYRALFQRGGGRAGETVLVHGATGGVGVAAVQFARAAGLRVLATGGSEAGRMMLAELGTEQVFDHSLADYTERILHATGGRGVDLIIEMLANQNLQKDVNMLARFGRVVVVGSRGCVELNPRDLMVRDADVRGLVVFNAPESDLAACHAAVGAGLDAGTLLPVIGEELPIEKAAEAHQLVMRGGHRGKIVLQCRKG